MRVCSSCPAIVGVAGPRRSFWPRLSGGAFLPPLTCIRRGNLDHHLTLLARRATVAGMALAYPKDPRRHVPPLLTLNLKGLAPGRACREAFLCG